MVSGASKIMLGTANFGLDYGIANRAGKVLHEEARSMVEYGLGRGMNSFDTAPGYGDSEKVLGEIFNELGVSGEDVFVSDKIPPVPEVFSNREAQDFIRGSVLSSLEKLGLDFIDVCLFHREKDAAFLDGLLKLRDEGLVKEAGVSFYYPGPALDLIEKGFAGALQVPASALDKRFLSAGVFERAERSSVSVFVRSVYLQGLMLMQEETPESLAGVRPVLRALRALAVKAGMGMGELALRYALSIPGASCIITGADGMKQLGENLDIAEKGPLEPGFFGEALKLVPELPEEILLPTLWKKEETNV